MDLTKIKKYPSQISSAFKRFPLASALAILASVIFIYLAECAIEDIPITRVRFIFWLTIYPIAAMIIALTTSLVQESLKSCSKIPPVATTVAWLGISSAIAIFCGPKDWDDDWNDFQIQFIVGTLLVSYVTSIFGLFIAPFFRQKNENGFWIHLVQTLKSLVVSLLVTSILVLAIELLLLGFFGLFGFDNATEKPFIYTAIFCASTILPLLFFSGIPSVDECLQKTPTLGKFITSVCRFLFIPVLSLSLVLFYCYIVKFFIQWSMPRDIVIALVIAFMVFLIALTLTMYPAYLNPAPSSNKKILKILSAASIPLVILMSVAIHGELRRFFSEEIIYLIAVNLFFYIAIAILLIDKIKCKFKYMAIIFSALLAIVTISPVNAMNIMRYVTIYNLKKAVVENGHIHFPLDDEETEDFIDSLNNKEDFESKKLFIRLKYLQRESPKDLENYISTTKKIEEQKNCCLEKKEIHRDTLHNIRFEKDDNIYDIPKNVTKFTRIEESFDDDEFQVRNDSIFFQISPKELDKTFDFAVPITDKPTSFESKDANIAIKYLKLFVKKEDDKIYQRLRLDGILFIK